MKLFQASIWVSAIALAADRRQRPIEDLIATGRHSQNVDHSPRIQRLQTRPDMLGLPHGQRAFAAGDNEFAGCHNGLESVETMAASLS